MDHQHKKPCNQAIARLQDYEFCEEVISTKLKDILTLKRQHLKQLQSDIDVHSEEHLENLYIKFHNEGNKTIKTILDEMKHREKQKRSWNRIHFITKKKGKAGVDRLGIPVGYE